MLRDRTFLFSFAISLFLHLTMVTLFSIEMRYEPKPIRYYPFDIVDVRQIAPSFPDAAPRLDLPGVDAAAFSERRDNAEYLATLPQISLPTLDFDVLPTLNLRAPSLEAPKEVLLMGPARTDAWAQFGEEIQEVRNALRSLPPFELLADASRRREETAPAAMEPLHPAPGTRGRIEWMSEPRDRELLFAPAASPLWPNGIPVLSHSVTIVFRVRANGSVGEIIAPVGERNELVDSVLDALKRYRFEPQSGRGEQPASLILEPEEGAR